MKKHSNHEWCNGNCPCISRKKSWIAFTTIQMLKTHYALKAIYKLCLDVKKQFFIYIWGGRIYKLELVGAQLLIVKLN